MRQISELLLIKKITVVCIMLSIMGILTSLFVSGLIGDYTFAIAFGLLISSIIVFGIILFINVMEEMTDGSQGYR